MAQQFDITLKHLIEAYPADWIALCGRKPKGPVEVIDSNLATVSAEVDKVILVHDPEPWLHHVEVQSTRDPTLPRRLLRYNVLLDMRHDVPVRSVAVLLRPEVDGAELTGLLQRHLPDDKDHLSFHYDVVRLWQLTPETLLAG